MRAVLYLRDSDQASHPDGKVGVLLPEVPALTTLLRRLSGGPAKKNNGRRMGGQSL
jgi:hypothetical protein